MSSNSFAGETASVLVERPPRTGRPLNDRRFTPPSLCCAASISFINSGDTCRVPLHFVLAHVVHPRKYRPRAETSFIGDPHSGHGSLTSTSGTSFFGGGAGSWSLSFSFNSAGSGLALRHFG